MPSSIERAVASVNAATDIDLVAAAAEGNQHAFEALVGRYQAPIISFARSYTGNDEDAEDLAQEVFVRIYRALRQFRGDSSLRTWVLWNRESSAGANGSAARWSPCSAMYGVKERCPSSG